MTEDNIKSLLTLPDWVEFEGCNFELCLMLSGGKASLCYWLTIVDDKSKHYQLWCEWSGWLNPLMGYENGYPCSFLCLCQNIEDDNDLKSAIDQFRAFLLEHGLLSRGEGAA